MIKYPAVLPLALISSRSNRQVNQIVRTEMMSGRARQRVAFESVPEISSVSFHFKSANEAVVWELWFQSAIKHDWIEMPLRFPDGLVERVCRFTSTYSGPNPKGAGQWVIEAEIELQRFHLESDNGIGDDWGEFPQYLLEANILDVTMNKHWPLSITGNMIFDRTMNHYWPEA